MMRERKGYEPVAIKIYLRDKSIIINEVSLLAYDKRTNKVLAVGEEVSKLLQNTSEDILVVCPLKYGIIADFNLSVVMFQKLIYNAIGKKSFRRPKIAVCVPIELTQVEEKAFTETFFRMGRKVLVLQKAADQGFHQIPKGYQIIVEIVPNN